MHIQLPEKVRIIIDTLEAAGFEAYAVGGCVRDCVLNRLPDDWDITTSARPFQIKEIFKRTVDTGLQHGTVTVILAGEGFEVTTYRIDGEYEDGRHPKNVVFTADLIEDLKRRDFTINAMAYNAQKGLIDVFCGMEDIQNQRIRCVGNPTERFTEDALRILRAVRFSAQLGYEIEEETSQAMVALAGSLLKISAERVRTELLKLINSPHPDFLKKAWQMGITAIVLPEFDVCMDITQNNPHHCHTVGVHLLQTMLSLPQDKVLRLAGLFHDIGKGNTKTTDESGTDHFYGHAKESAALTRKIMKRLKFDNETLHMVSELVFFHDYEIIPTAAAVRRAINKVGELLFPLLLQLKKADILAQSKYAQDKKLHRLSEICIIYEHIQKEKHCVTLRTLAVTGRDLIEAGMEPGKEIGQVLHLLLEKVMEEPELNTKDELLAIYKGLSQENCKNNSGV